MVVRGVFSLLMGTGFFQGAKVQLFPRIIRNKVLFVCSFTNENTENRFVGRVPGMRSCVKCNVKTTGETGHAEPVCRWCAGKDEIGVRVSWLTGCAPLRLEMRAP